MNEKIHIFPAVNLIMVSAARENPREH